MNTFDLSLDLSKSRNVNPIRLRQGDLNGTTIRALIFDHGALADLSGTTARWVMRLPGGEEYYRKAATVDATARTVTVEVDETQAASVSGRCRGYFQILDGSTVIASTGDVLVEVLPDALEGATVAESYDSAIQDAIDALDAAVDAIPDTVEDVLEAHPEWTTTVQDGSVTDAKLYQGKGGILARNQRLMYRLANLLTHRTDEGTLAAISDAAKTPMAGLSVYGLSTQDGTPTPSSPVPIVSVEGDSEGNISLRAQGKNLATITNRPATSNGINLTYNADGSVTLSGTATAQSVIWLNSKALNLTAGTYTMSVSGLQTGVVMQFAHQMESGGSITYDYGSSSGPSATFAIPSGCYMNDFRFVISNGATVNTTVYVQIEVGSTATAYQPYVAATTTPIDLDGHELRSLPDGTRDELTVGADGHVTLVQRVGSVDLGTLTWSYDASSLRFYVRTLDIAATTSGYDQIRALCTALSPSEYRYISAVSAFDNVMGAVVSGGITYFAAKATAYSSVTNFVAAMDGVTLIYALATPQTIDLGWTDAIPLCGPDLTAQSVPTAPFALTYERDLNVTLARLEAALAEIATS